MNETSKDTRVIIREYSSQDHLPCLALFDSNRPKYFAESERALFSDWLNKIDRGSFSVMEKAREIIACGGIYHDAENNSTGLAWGMVRRDLHRQGYGRRLTQFRIEQMSDQFPSLDQRLGTSQHTFRFYRKLGFEIEKVTPDGFGEGIDRYDMVRRASRES